MSIDLVLDLKRPVSLRPLLPRMRLILSDMLGVKPLPEFLLEGFHRGQRLPLTTDELLSKSSQLGPEPSPHFLVSLAGEPEDVELAVSFESVWVTMDAQRTNLKYAMGAAVAITLARELGGTIADAMEFFGVGRHPTADELLEHLRVHGQWNNYREAAEQLATRIDQVS